MSTSSTTHPPHPTAGKTKIKERLIRVCVLSPSYEGSNSATKEWDSLIATPKHFFPEGFVETETITSSATSPSASVSGCAVAEGTTTTTTTVVNTRYTFDYVELNKATSYREVRSLVKSNKYDVYFNLCDGAKDEDRAGEEVVRTLEEFNVPFTGASSKFFELSKPDMKMMAHYCKIPTARHAVLDANDLAPLPTKNKNKNKSEKKVSNVADPSETNPLSRSASAGGCGLSSPSAASSCERFSAPVTPPPADSDDDFDDVVIESEEDDGNEEDDGTVSTKKKINKKKKKFSPSEVIALSDDVLSELPMRLEAKCSHLRFPVIVKHVSGYASIGMTRENKCNTMLELKKRAAIFIAEFDFALVEEFISGDEATVLACADDTAKDGIRVYHPVMVNFPPGSDFKHFELKWTAYEGMEWRLVPDDDPALPQIMEIGRKSFKEMMGGIGYGRCDLRINRDHNNEVVFLEINPNCGIMYPIGQEGSADYILQMEVERRQRREAAAAAADVVVDKLKGQRDFAILQIKNAIARCEKTKPLWYRSFDSKREFHLRATRDIKKGTVVFYDEGRSVRLFTRPFVEQHWSEEDKEAFAENAWPIGATSSSASSAPQPPHHYFAVWDINPATWRTFNHSESEHANLVFGPNRSLNVVAARDIRKGEELTMNYALLKTENMPQPKKEPKRGSGGGV